LDLANAQKEAEAKTERDAETARQVEANRIEREKQVAEARAHAEQIRLERQENERAATVVRAAQEAEAKRLADEKADLAKREEELRKASEPKPRPRKAPSGQELAEVVAKHYSVETKVAIVWLTKINWKQEIAA
jgi:hypothetical protein